MNITYPQKLRKKDLKKIDKYDCPDEIKKYYVKYLPNFPFESFVKFYNQIDDDLDMYDIILDFVDVEVEKYGDTSMKSMSNRLLSYLVYFDVNLDVGEYYSAFISMIQFILTVVSFESLNNEIPCDEVPFPKHAVLCLKKLFDKDPDFEYDLKSDCYSFFDSSDSSYSFSKEEFYDYVKSHFDEMGYF